MLRSMREGAGSRALAALVALALSGVPSLASALRSEKAHVCQCRAHGREHRCACPVCARLAREARRGAVEKLPPCHREMALAELADEEARAALVETRSCLKPTCGGEEGLAGAPGGDSFLAPRAPSLAPPRGVGRLAARAARGLDFPAVPDVPPPRP